MSKHRVYVSSVIYNWSIAIQWLLTPSRGVLTSRLLMPLGFQDTSSLSAFDNIISAYDNIEYEEAAPNGKSINRWYTQFEETGSVWIFSGLCSNVSRTL